MFICHLPHVDSSLASDSVLAATETLEPVAGNLVSCLSIPICKRQELRASHDVDDYRRHLVDYYVKISPYSSWSGLHHVTLCYGEVMAAERVEQHITGERGTLQ